MDFNKLERTFSDFIINLVGPNAERDKERNDKYTIIKSIMEKLFYEIRNNTSCSSLYSISECHSINF